MQLNTHFIRKTKHQSIVCDSRSNFGFSKLNAICRPRNVMQFNAHFIGQQKKRQSIVCDSRGGLKEPQGKQGSEIVEKALVFMSF